LGRFLSLLNQAVFLEAAGAVFNWLEPKTKTPSGNLACPNLLNALQYIVHKKSAMNPIFVVFGSTHFRALVPDLEGLELDHRADEVVLS